MKYALLFVFAFVVLVSTEDLEGLRKQLYGRIDALAKLIQNDIKTYENTKVNTTEEFKDLKRDIPLLEKYRHDVDIAENLDQLHLVENSMNYEEQVVPRFLGLGVQCPPEI
ncbi:unnamed protein product, partial [Oppiella nova]